MENNEKNENKGFLGVFKGAVDTVKSTAQNIKIPEVKLPEVKLPEIKMPNLFQKPAEKPTEPARPPEIRSISSKSAVSIVYYMMAVDGEIYQSEEEKFDEIGKALDPNFDENKAQVIAECQAQMGKVIDPEDQYEALQDGVEEAILAGANAKDSVITPKMLVWDLLTIAYSDGKYDDNERRLLKYIVRKLNIDKAVFLEMESSFLTLVDLESEMTWIKTTNRPYLTIEAMVNEISDRKTAIFDSIKDLIAF